MERETEEFPLRLYNSKTKQKEVFKPKVAGKVGMYVCGVTPYDDSHIGHARSAVVYDLLYRFLKSKGYEVNYVRNFTDIDDKIIAKANEFGVGTKELSDRYINEYHDNMKEIQCLPPTEEPRVTDHIEQIKNMIHQIIKNEFAYTFEGNVYFEIDKFPNYGQLSGNKKEGNRIGEPGPGKRDPNDFALWKATYIFHPLALRHSLMSTHYRSPFNYMTSQLEISSEAVFHIYQTLQDCKDVLDKYQGLKEGAEPKAQITFEAQDCLNKLRRNFQFFMSDDLHTPEILNVVLRDTLKFINRDLNLPKKQHIQFLVEVRDEVEQVLQVLGLYSPSMTYAQVLQELKEKALKRANLTEEEVLHQIEERDTARKNKDYSRSDQIRDCLAAKGIALMDEGKITVWRPCRMDQENLVRIIKEYFTNLTVSIQL